MFKNISKFAALTIVLFVLLSVTIHAYPLEKRSRIELRGTLWNPGSSTTSISSAYVVVKTNISAGGMLTYAYWARENLAVTLSLGVLASQVDVRTSPTQVSTQVVSVMPILAGVRYYLPKSTYRNSFRPYAAIALGTYIGSESKVRVGSTVVTTVGTETALGGFLGAGLDLQLSRLYMLGVSGGYNLMTDYSKPLGGRDNYSGPEFAIGISFLFGKGVGK